jgi:hypothetical protein
MYPDPFHAALKSYSQNACQSSNFCLKGSKVSRKSGYLLDDRASRVHEQATASGATPSWLRETGTITPSRKPSPWRCASVDHQHKPIACTPYRLAAEKTSSRKQGGAAAYPLRHSDGVLGGAQG